MNVLLPTDRGQVAPLGTAIRTNRPNNIFPQLVPPVMGAGGLLPACDRYSRQYAQRHFDIGIEHSRKKTDGCS